MKIEYLKKNEIPQRSKKKAHYMPEVEKAYENGEECIVFHFDTDKETRSGYNTLIQYYARHREDESGMVASVNRRGNSVYVGLNKREE